MLRTRILCALTIAVAAPSSDSLGASYSIFAEIEQRNPLNAERSYSFELSLSRTLPRTQELELEIVAPDGSRFGEPALDLDFVLAHIYGLRPEDVNSRYAGKWTINERLEPGVLNQYEFIIPEISETNPTQFPSQATITTPRSGAVVGPTFDVTWDPPLADRQFFIRNSAPGLRPFFTTRASGATLSYPAGSFPIEVMEFAVVATREATSLRVEPVNEGADSTFEIRSLEFGTYSTPISFTIVPEPQSALLLAVAVALALRYDRGARRENANDEALSSRTFR